MPSEEPLLRYCIEHACESLDIAAMADLRSPWQVLIDPANVPAVAVDCCLAIARFRQGDHLAPSCGRDQFAAIQRHHEQAKIAGTRIDTATGGLLLMSSKNGVRARESLD